MPEPADPSNSSPAAAGPSLAVPESDDGRIIGRYGAGGGPTVLCVGGIHGNEPSGVHALRRVIRRLETDGPEFRGRLLAVTGNLPALAERKRFVERDLNRGWSVREVSETMSAPAGPEDHEQIALLDLLVPEIREADGRALVLDLHTTSSPSAPFITLGDELETRRFAQRLEMPLVLGIEEEIDTMVEYLAGFGALAIGIEGGQHDDPASVDNHEAALWLALDAAGCLPAPMVNLDACRERIRRARAGLPDVFEVIYRRAIEPEDRFRMEPGFRNFAELRIGDPIARDADGPVVTPMSGRLFLPLYQEQGDDGYFVVRPVRPVWLEVSRVLRRAGAPALLPLLPGVRRSTRHEDTFIVSRRVARWAVNEVFHLLGYRRVKETESHIVFRGRQPMETSTPSSAER